MKQTTRWSDLSPGQQTALLVLVSVEMSLTSTAVVDLIRRPAGQMRGRKAWWALGMLVQPIGPLAYLAIGPRRSLP
jgi:hypothetical protein